MIADLSFQAVDGAPVSFSTARGECGAKLLLVSTSAGWCTACREEQPLLQRLSEEHAAAGLVVCGLVWRAPGPLPAFPPPVLLGCCRPLGGLAGCAGGLL